MRQENREAKGMKTLRKIYHDLGNKLHFACVLASSLKEMTEALKENPKDKKLAEKIAKDAAIIESKIVETNQEFTDLKKIIYRSIDPDVDIQIVLDKIKEENKKIKIFIVDDEQIITEELRKKYESDGYIIDSALDAEEAIKKIHEFEPNILLTDLYMPGAKSGVDIIKFVKEKMGWIQILVVSRVDDEKLIKEIKELGVDTILIKPVKFADINAKLSGMIQSLKR